MKKISILGSTGSIGTQTLDVARRHEGEIEVVALAAGENIKLLEEQIREFRPALVSVKNEECASALRAAVADQPVTVACGMEGLKAVATADEAEMVVTAVVGMMGIVPTIAAIEAGKDIALANKETLVCAGHIIMDLAERHGVKILPVDSEHSAIFQSLGGERDGGNAIDRILLTASGGPFRGMTREQLGSVTLSDTLRHPTWSMGKKVTIDSATLVNKGLEVMEAKWLFGVEPERIQVVVHPQSVIHSMVQYEDGAVIAQLGLPDMRLPIQYALFYPRRVPLGVEKLDFYKLGSLTFEKPDTETFMGLALAVEALKKGGNMPTVFNAANEAAVALFMREKISFLEIAKIIGESMAAASFCPNPDVAGILETEAAVRGRIEGRWGA